MQRCAHKLLQNRSRGFTLIELLVVMAVIVILVSITSWGISLANTSAKTNHCANLLRQIGIAFHWFLHAFGKTPDANTVLNVLGEYLETQSLIYICPAVPEAALGINVSYGVNPFVHRLLAESAKEWRLMPTLTRSTTKAWSLRCGRPIPHLGISIR